MRKNGSNFKLLTLYKEAPAPFIVFRHAVKSKQDVN